MICEECGVNPASIRLITVINGNKRERNLCPACMAKLKNPGGTLDFSSLVGLLGGILQAAEKPADGDEGDTPEITCPKCGQTYEAFRKTGYLGCPGCYRAFSEPLEALLKRVHGSTQHTGRVPGGIRGTVALKLNIDGLKQKLGRAIAEEEYEEAARLRDQIRALNKELEALEGTEKKREESEDAK